MAAGARAEIITGHKGFVTVAVMAAGLMAFVDISIVNVALSDIRASFGAPLNQISWVTTAYMIANVVVIPLSGWLQRRVGFRAYFTFSIVVFTAASMLCGLAWSLPALIVFRGIQGLGGGAIIPTAQAILFLRYPKAQHGLASSLFGLAAITGPLLGPYVGGAIIGVSSWHWIFLINVPLGIIAALLSWGHVREPGFVRRHLPVDRAGIVLLVVGLVSLQYVLEEGNREDWLASPLIIGGLATALVCLVTFVVHELEVASPVLDLDLFKNRSYAAASTINFLVGVSVFSGSFMFALFCGTVLAYPAIDIGVLLLKGNLITIPLMAVMGAVMGKVDGRLFIGGGVLLMAYSLWMNGHLTPEADQWALVAPLLLRAFAIAAVFIPLMPYALSDVAPERRGNASAMFNLMRELGGSIGIAWMTTMLDNHSKAYVSTIGRHVDVFDPSTVSEVAGIEAYLHGAVWNPSSAALAVVDGRIKLQALSIAFNDGFVVAAIAFVLSLGLVVLLKRPRDLSVDAGGH